MLPLLRVLPVGSLLLTALIFMLASTPPRTRVLPHALGPASGPLIDAAEHPEWRQFYLQAAFKRAGELEHLSELPNTPTRMPVVTAPEPANIAAEPQTAAEVVVAIAPRAQPNTEVATPVPPAMADDTPPQQIAGLPAERVDAAPEDITGALDSPVVTATIPMEIGETSSTELPIVLPPERPSPLPPPRPKAGSRAKTPKVARPAKQRRQSAPATKQQPAKPAAFRSRFGESV